MGFFDSFKKSFEEENQRLSEQQKYSNYRTVEQRELDRRNELSRKSDGILLNKMRDTFTSDEDKKLIKQILKERGYWQGSDGVWHR